MPAQDEDWPAYRRMVLGDLERIKDTLEKIRTDLGGIRTEIELLKLKASVWGVASGALSGAVVAAGALLMRGT